MLWEFVDVQWWVIMRCGILLEEKSLNKSLLLNQIILSLWNVQDELDQWLLNWVAVTQKGLQIRARIHEKS